LEMGISQTLSGWHQTIILLIASQVIRITVVSHLCPASVLSVDVSRTRLFFFLKAALDLNLRVLYLLGNYWTFF
jgi:hypothetical protein